jgi:hypothetical protein
MVAWLCWRDPDGCYADSDSFVFNQPFMSAEYAEELMAEFVSGKRTTTPDCCKITHPPRRPGFIPANKKNRKRLADALIAEGKPVPDGLRTPAKVTPFKLEPSPKPFRKPKFENNAAKPAKALFAGGNCIAGQGELFNPNGKE